MGRLINTTSMTIDGVTDVGDWFVAQGDYDEAARAIFESEGAAMLVGRKSLTASPASGPPSPVPGPTS